MMMNKRGRLSDVSIHAPAEGATSSQMLIEARIVVSIHAPAEGATIKMPALNMLARFQSTRPRRARPPADTS